MEEEKNETESKQPNHIDAAKELLARIEAANKESMELLQRKEQMMAEELLSGRAAAGVPTKELSHDEIVRNRCNEWLKPFGRQI